MKKKYNIAFTPNTINQQVIQLAQACPITVKNYLLGEQALPHVTLHFLYLAENELLAVWQKICSLVTDTKLSLQFNDISYMSFDKQLFWGSLLPEHREQLDKIHRLIADILLLLPKKIFTPHMTLFNTLDAAGKTRAAQVLKPALPISDVFTLSLGESDEVGQLMRIIFKTDFGD